MFRQHPKLGRAEGRTHGPGHARPPQLLRMDRSSAFDRARGSGRQAGGEMDAGRRRRRGVNDAQHPDRKGARRRLARLCAKWRAAAARAGLSAPLASARIRRQHQRQVASAAQTRSRTVPNARGDLEIQHAHARRLGAPVQPGDGGEVGRHLSVWGAASHRAWILRDHRRRLVGIRKGRPCRSDHGRRRVLARRRATRTHHVEVPHPVSRALELGRRPGDACEPRH